MATRRMYKGDNKKKDEDEKDDIEKRPGTRARPKSKPKSRPKIRPRGRPTSRGKPSSSRDRKDLGRTGRANASRPSTRGERRRGNGVSGPSTKKGYQGRRSQPPVSRGRSRGNGVSGPSNTAGSLERAKMVQGISQGGPLPPQAFAPRFGPVAPLPAAVVTPDVGIQAQAQAQAQASPPPTTATTPRKLASIISSMAAGMGSPLPMVAKTAQEFAAQQAQTGPAPQPPPMSPPQGGETGFGNVRATGQAPPSSGRFGLNSFRPGSGAPISMPSASTIGSYLPQGPFLPQGGGGSMASKAELFGVRLPERLQNQPVAGGINPATGGSFRPPPTSNIAPGGEVLPRGQQADAIRQQAMANVMTPESPLGDWGNQPLTDALTNSLSFDYNQPFGAIDVDWGSVGMAPHEGAQFVADYTKQYGKLPWEGPYSSEVNLGIALNRAYGEPLPEDVVPGGYQESIFYDENGDPVYPPDAGGLYSAPDQAYLWPGYAGGSWGDGRSGWDGYGGYGPRINPWFYANQQFGV